jgi:glycerol kinase
MPDAVLAIDAGTTSVRALVVDPDGGILGRARSAYKLDYPAPGWVEQNPEQLWTATQGVVESALAKAGLRPSDLCAVGITAQRSSCVVWERTKGRTLSPLVGWQDLRGTQRALELQQQGFLVLPQSAASKLEMMLETIDDGRERMARGELAWGNVDSFLASRLSGGEAHITDPSHACTTGYYDLETGGWHAAMVDLQGLNPACFPLIVDSSGPLGKTAKSVFGAEVTIGAIIGDQQSAAIAQGCREPGDGKMTYGTCGTFNVHTGSRIVGVQGTYPLVLIRQSGKTSYCVEGMVITAGAVFDWLADGLGALENPAQASAVAASVEDTHGVYMLPALQGLGAPYLDLERTALIGGITRGATKAHVARAAMEGIAFRVREMLDRIYEDSGLPRPSILAVDGGASVNDLFMQIQADTLGQPVERMTPIEATVFGAAILAGQAEAVWGAGAVDQLRKIDRTFEPTWSADERDERFDNWRRSCGLLG